jgi:hypothetical protein
MISQKNNVWQAWPCTEDVSDAERFGRLLQPIFDPRKVSPHDVARMQDVIRSEVLPFACLDDHILTVGPQMVVLTLAITWTLHFGKSPLVLVWDRPERRYVSKYL